MLSGRPSRYHIPAHWWYYIKLWCIAFTLSPQRAEASNCFIILNTQGREIARDAQSINEDVAGYVGDVLIERARKIADIGLSQREVQIIRLSAEGLKASEIAERTFLSVHTVNTHRQRIYAKMDVGNISEMLHKAQELGII